MFAAVEELLNKITNFESDESENFSLTELFFDDEFDSEYISKYSNSINELRQFIQSEGFSIKCVEAIGGEDEGRDYYKVYKFTNTSTGQECFVKFQGWYASYYGSEFESYFEVTPQEVVVIEYKSVTK